MADANIDQTTYIATEYMYPTIAEEYDTIGVVAYYKAFATNGVQIWMVPK